MIKKLLLEIIDYYRDKIVNDNCTEAEMRDIFALVSSKIVGDSTIADNISDRVRATSATSFQEGTSESLRGVYRTTSSRFLTSFLRVG